MVLHTCYNYALPIIRDFLLLLVDRLYHPNGHLDKKPLSQRAHFFFFFFFCCFCLSLVKSPNLMTNIVFKLYSQKINAKPAFQSYELHRVPNFPMSGVGLPYDWYNELIFPTFPLISRKIYAVNFPQNEVKNCKYYYTYYKSLAHTKVLYDVANTTTTSSFHFSITTETD